MPFEQGKQPNGFPDLMLQDYPEEPPDGYYFLMSGIWKEKCERLEEDMRRFNEL